MADYVRSLRYEVHDLGRRDDDRLSAADDVEAVWLALKYVSRTTAPPEIIVRILARLTDGTLLARQIVRYILTHQHWIGAISANRFPNHDNRLASAGDALFAIPQGRADLPRSIGQHHDLPAE